MAAKKIKKQRPVLRALVWTAGVAALFCMSVLVGMMSEGKRPYFALFKKASQGEVRGESTDGAPSSLKIGQSGDISQAPGVQEQTSTLTADGPYYQYIDTIKGADVIVARQPLPDDFKTSPNALQQLAANIGAKESFTTRQRGMAYMLSSQSTQVITFVYEQRLVFLRSTQPHTTGEWKDYIDNLKLQ